ncbi:spinster family MFS transporter [Amphritea sp.]|uniref:spinster family MFS transporter n=1 Tax=Amphritea sp. TaxID=1872502 RepID=UPI0035691444
METVQNLATKPAQTGEKLKRWYVLILLTLVYMTSVADRNIFAILLPHIQAEWALSDTQLGLLSGVAFGIFYAVLGIPIAFLADRSNRRNIIAGALGLFSLMTVVCGFAGNFMQMLFSRMGVGVGEAGTSPPTHSILSDYFPPSRRNIAMGVLNAGAFFGILVGFVVGGAVAEQYGWRAAFYVLGVPGLLLALVVWLTVEEPVRGASENSTSVVTVEIVGVKEVFAFLWQQKSYRHTVVLFALASFIAYGMFTWMPTYLVRTFVMDTKQIGMMLGGVLFVSGVAGSLASGWIIDHLTRKDLRWSLWILAFVILMLIPPMVTIFMTDSAIVAIACFAAPGCLMAFVTPAVITLAQRLAPLRMRAVSSAVLFFFGALIGIGLGPVFVGVLSDVLQSWSGDASLRYALLALCPIALWVVAHCLLGSRTLIDDIKRAESR